jgi:hypothetical protein
MNFNSSTQDLVCKILILINDWHLSSSGQGPDFSLGDLSVSAIISALMKKHAAEGKEDFKRMWKL